MKLLEKLNVILDEGSYVSAVPDSSGRYTIDKERKLRDKRNSQIPQEH